MKWRNLLYIFSNIYIYFIFLGMWIKQRLVVQMGNKLGASKTSGCQREMWRSQTEQDGLEGVKPPHHTRATWMINRTWPDPAKLDTNTKVVCWPEHVTPWRHISDLRRTGSAQQLSEMSRAACKNLQTMKDNVHFSVVVFMRESTWFHPVNIFHTTPPPPTWIWSIFTFDWTCMVDLTIKVGTVLHSNSEMRFSFLT